MCGISGIALHANASLDLRVTLAAMTQRMHHRGPDDGGFWYSPDGRVALGNRRLAIRDLSPAGHMPMGNSEETLWITYNGEIYDTAPLRRQLEAKGYTFRSDSDTEVILHGYAAWGAEIVNKIRGMFAFAIYDGRGDEPRLFLARDRLGIKPIYYATVRQGFVFASELNSLLASNLVSRDLDPQGLQGYLLLGSVPNPHTIYRDIRALEPGHTVTLRLKSSLAQPVPLPYWTLPSAVQRADPDEALARVRAALCEAVRLRLVSDVPLGAFLSGGLDSSAVVALMRKATNGPLRTCSMVFGEREYSEASYAQAMAQAVGAEHYERLIGAEEVFDTLPAIFAAMDQPTIDGVNTYFVSETAKQAGLTVALSGLGGDELFGGYPNTFQQVPRVTRALRMAHLMPIGAPLAQTAIKVLPDRERWGRIHDALGRPSSRASAYLTRRGLFSLSEARSLLSPDWNRRADFDAPLHVAERANADVDDFLWVSRAELATYTHHQLLRDTDIMSMAHSLEVRVPLLDHILVETVLSLPTHTKQGGDTPKPLLAKAVADLLPPLVRDRRAKQGFTFPFDRWLKGPLRESLDPTQGKLPPFLQAAGVKQLWHQYQQGKVHWSRVWAVIALSQWHRQTQQP